MQIHCRNIIAWASFTAQNIEHGYLQFYASGNTKIIFDKPIVNVGVASAASQSKVCSNAITTAYTPSTAYLDVKINLCPYGYCENPCPGVLAPQAMGYDPFNSKQTQMEFTVDMDSVATALAVNMGMTQLNHLVQIPNDLNRITLMNDMVSQGLLNFTLANQTSSYYGEENFFWSYTSHPKYFELYCAHLYFIKCFFILTQTCCMRRLLRSTGKKFLCISSVRIFL